MADQPTQAKHPGRATFRTTIAAVVGLVPLAPFIVAELGVNSVPWIVTVLGVTAAVTRVLAVPQVNDWLREHAPWLSAAGANPNREDPR